MIARLLRRWLRPENKGWVNIKDIDPNLELEWQIKWKFVDQVLIFDANSVGIATMVVEMNNYFQEIPEGIWVSFDDGRLTRVM